MNEPIFSSLTGKGAGFTAAWDGFWMSAGGPDYCPAGTYDGVNYYHSPGDNFPGRGSYYMWRSSGYWYVANTTEPGGVGAPSATVQSNSSTPPLSGWSNGGVLVAGATC